MRRTILRNALSVERSVSSARYALVRLFARDEAEPDQQRQPHPEPNQHISNQNFAHDPELPATEESLRHPRPTYLAAAAARASWVPLCWPSRRGGARTKKAPPSDLGGAKSGAFRDR